MFLPINDGTIFEGHSTEWKPRRTYGNVRSSFTLNCSIWKQIPLSFTHWRLRWNRDQRTKESQDRKRQTKDTYGYIQTEISLTILKWINLTKQSFSKDIYALSMKTVIRWYRRLVFWCKQWTKTTCAEYSTSKSNIPLCEEKDTFFNLPSLPYALSQKKALSCPSSNLSFEQNKIQGP